MNNEVGLVTAFFEIGRENFPVYSRLNEEYFDYFKMWCGLNNKLIVFCDKKNSDRISKIRKKRGVKKEKLLIIEIDNIYEIEADIYMKMRTVEEDNSYKDYRLYSVACSNMASYDYVMLLKYFFLYQASLTDFFNDIETIAWIDFGFNHGNAYYLNMDEFNFTWRWKTEKPITFFALYKPDRISILDSLQFQKDCIQGCIVGLEKKYASILWKWVKEMMCVLLALDAIDDDQQLLLMVYKSHCELINIIECGWFQAIELTSGRKFTTKDIIKDGRYDCTNQFLDWNDRNKKRIKQYFSIKEE